MNFSQGLVLIQLTHFIRNTILVVVTLFIWNTILVVVCTWHGFPALLTFWNPIGWLTPNDVSILGSLGYPYFQPISDVLWVFAVQSEHPQAS